MRKREATVYWEGDLISPKVIITTEYYWDVQIAPIFKHDLFRGKR